MRSVVRALFLFVCTMVCSSSHAQVLFSYDFNGSAGTQANNPATLGSGVSVLLNVSSISRGPGISGNAGANSLNSTGFTVGGTAIDLNDYQTFSVDPSAGVMSMSSLQFRTQRSATGPPNVELHYSLDGFATAGINVGSFVAPTTSTPNLIDVSGVSALQNLSQPVQFRLYEYGGTGAAGTFRLTNLGASSAIADHGVIVIGTFIPVPEPATVLGVAAFGAFVVGGFRRRFAKSA